MWRTGPAALVAALLLSACTANSGVETVKSTSAVVIPGHTQKPAKRVQHRQRRCQTRTTPTTVSTERRCGGTSSTHLLTSGPPASADEKQANSDELRRIIYFTQLDGGGMIVDDRKRGGPALNGDVCLGMSAGLLSLMSSFTPHGAIYPTRC